MLLLLVAFYFSLPLSPTFISPARNFLQSNCAAFILHDFYVSYWAVFGKNEKRSTIQLEVNNGKNQIVLYQMNRWNGNRPSFRIITIQAKQKPFDVRHERYFSIKKRAHKRQKCRKNKIITPFACALLKKKSRRCIFRTNKTTGRSKCDIFFLRQRKIFFLH